MFLETGDPRSLTQQSAISEAQVLVRLAVTPDDPLTLLTGFAEFGGDAVCER